MESNVEVGASKETKKRASKKRFHGCFSGIGCFEAAGDDPIDRGVEVGAEGNGGRPTPTHLVVMVNGIIGSSSDWRYAAKHLGKRFPEDLVVHCSERNTSTLTLHGVDVMGERLAKEVISVIERKPELRKISFIGHSLGGLVARYAIGRLYGQTTKSEPSAENGGVVRVESETLSLEEESKGKIAGLEPMNFITFATPHLGSRGYKQVPLFCGVRMLEKASSHISGILGKTGKHLLLNDHHEGRPPLLIQMVNDCGDLKFMSALQSFRRCVAYANAHFDHIVGWSTSSIRPKHELPKRKNFQKNDKYPHVMNVETSKPANIHQDILWEGKAKTVDMEGIMIRGLNRVGWERVDVSFRRSKQRYLAHTTIQVKTYCLNSDGIDVVFHMIDNFLL